MLHISCSSFVSKIMNQVIMIVKPNLLHFVYVYNDVGSNNFHSSITGIIILVVTLFAVIC